MIDDYLDYLKAYVRLEALKIAAEMLKGTTVKNTDSRKLRKPFKNVSDRTHEDIQSFEQSPES